MVDATPAPGSDPAAVADELRRLIHDLNNVLGVALGQASLAVAAADAGSAPRRETLALTVDALRRAGQLTAELSAVSDRVAPDPD